MTRHGDLASTIRGVVRTRAPDALRIHAWIYWADLVTTAIVGWLLFWLSTRIESSTAFYCLTTATSILVQLRLLVFLHEISHGRTPRSFECAWNLVAGLPMGVPSLMYNQTHRGHHDTRTFATCEDPEYAPIGDWSRSRRVLFILSGFFVPFLLVVRWGLLAPLSALSSRVRRETIARFSTLSINPAFRRREIEGRGGRRWLVLEASASLFTWSVAIAVLLGILPRTVVLQWFVLIGGIFFVNQIRTLVAHRYERYGAALTLEEQFLESINLVPHAITGAIAPLGLRYHGLHHLLPELPYYSLGRVHRMLSEMLPVDSTYRSPPEEGLGRIARLLAASH